MYHQDMRAYVIRRVLLVVPTLFILTIVVFLSVRFLPGDVIDAMAGDLQHYIGFDRAALERRLGLDVPVPVQYGRWIGGVFLHGTLGESLWSDSPVEELLRGGLPVTLGLGFLAIVIGLVIALPVGIFSAIRQGTVTDYAGRSVAIIGLATPNFWIAVMVLLYPAIWWGWSPPLQWVPFTEDPLGNLGVLIIPSLILGTYLSASTMRMIRTTMLEVLRQDYVRTAWSKGLRERIVVLRHAVKNALIPVVSLIGLQLPILVGGSVIIENIFNLPGVGRLMVDALGRRDYPVVSGVNLMFATGVMAINLATDLIGGTSGFLGGKLDLVVQRFVDAWMSFPGLLLLLTVMSITGRGIVQLIVVLGIVGGIPASRVVRGAVIGVKENAYFQAAEVIGSATWKTLVRHVLPNIAAPIIVIFSINIGAVIITEASLSFLGFGLPLQIPSWGGMLSREGRRYMEMAPRLALWPGLCLTIVVYSLNMFGDAVRDLLDPRLRGGGGRLGAGS